MATSCLIQFGRSGFVGRFTAAAALPRAERVIIRGPRGIEPGVVLCEPGEPFEGVLAAEGEVLRVAEPEDEKEIAKVAARAAELLEAASAAAQQHGLPLAFVDAELTLDHRLILHGLAWAACDATSLFEQLCARFGMPVRLLDLSRIPTTNDKQSGCGKPGCGSESGGCSSCGSEGGSCSTGSCSRGSVKSSEELTAYFADLRLKMEAAGLTRTPLH